jgi:hypothetical protein
LIFFFLLLGLEIDEQQQMKQRNKNILLACGLIALALVTRILGREMAMYNFAPVTAIALFGGSVIRDKRISFLMPLVAMLLADLYLQYFTNMPGFYGKEQLFVYGGMVLVTLLGTTLRSINAVKVLGYSLTGSMIFFIVSNLGSFFSGMYGLTFNGLVTTYVNAIPFYQHSLVSDMVGGCVLFGAYALYQRAYSTKAQKA